MTPGQHDVLVVGAGPAGAAASHWLARHGHDVLVVDKTTFPRDKSCGDTLTPRAVRELADMGLTDQLEPYHVHRGVRAVAHGTTVELAWPAHPRYPSHGYVVRRRTLDQLVVEQAIKAGASFWPGAEAVEPVVERGFVRGALVRRGEASRLEEVRARYVIVADGAASRFGRALGTTRNRAWPHGIAIRGYVESPRHDSAWIESNLDVRDRQGRSLPGYGWAFPLGDGTVNVGVGLLSTFRDWKGVNTGQLLADLIASAPPHWELAPGRMVGSVTGGRLPLGGSVGPKAGPTYLVAGDAAGTVNPFTGGGIDTAFETGRLAAEVLHEALVDGDPMALRQYPARLESAYGRYYTVGRLFAQALGRPLVMRELTRVGIHQRTLMEWSLRIMANLLRPEDVGPAEAAYKVVAALSRLAPTA